ncbi:BA14K family protein [Lutibaculum baratangense]|uniref:Lectin-like protein BA14k n=1 Tax=Lutibaculum baratangense AMV1 TaxID=631454 RepID=V4RJL0_9HYPH|nr:BA14K family protein [Lutibaculum baratangense]ESR23420.1 hypothetical protein N177_3488 [Lutibaculum baratangense AMV1]
MSLYMKRGACAALVAIIAATTTVPATAQNRGGYRDRDAYIERYYKSNRHDDEYRRWQRDRHRWSQRDYDRWYRSRHRGSDNAAAAIFGLAAGAIAGAAISSANRSSGSGIPSAGGYPAGSDGWYRYCSSKYRSFDPGSGTYLGYDGQRHYCR